MTPAVTPLLPSDELNFESYKKLYRHLLEGGVDGIMSIPPYYFHFTDGSVYKYYNALAKEIHGNIYLYNFPERTAFLLKLNFYFTSLHKYRLEYH